MEIKHYLMIAKHWAWLLALGLGLGTLFGYGYSKRQTPVYLSTTKVLIVRAAQTETSDLAYLSSQELGQTFIQLLETSQILKPASEKLGFSVSAGQVNASLVNTTRLISLQVEDTSPEQAAMIANTLVEVLIEENDNLQSSRYKANEESLNAQVRQVQAQITSLQDEIDSLTTSNVQEQTTEVEKKISELQLEIAELDYQAEAIKEQNRYYYTNISIPPDLTARQAQLKSALQLYQDIYSNLVILGKPTETGVSDRISYLERTQELYQQIYLQLLGDLENVRLARLENTPNIVQIEPATVPQKPIRPHVGQDTMMAAALGLALAGGIIFLIEYTDDTLRTPFDVDQTLGLPVLGYIADMNLPVEKGQVHVTAYPRSQAAEAFRTLRAAIDLSGETPPKTILITSSRSGEGKTTIAANLAAIYSQTGKKVILVDTDLRRPAVHTAFGIPNRQGLTTLLKSSLKLEKIWKQFDTGNRKKMRILTCGHLPPNPAELLGSDEMLRLMAELHKHADIIIFDSPPIIVADVQILASLVDGVILVLRPGKSPREEAEATLVNLERSGAKTLGVTFNRTSKKGGHGYGEYGYYDFPSNDYYTKRKSKAYIN